MERTGTARHKPEPEPRHEYKAKEPDYFPELRACLERGNLMTAWERDFVASLLERDWPRLSEKSNAASSIVFRRNWRNTRICQR